MPQAGVNKNVTVTPDAFHKILLLNNVGAHNHLDYAALSRSFQKMVTTVWVSHIMIQRTSIASS